MFKNITNFAVAMKNLTQLSSQVRAMQTRLEAARVVGTGKGQLGDVRVEMNGLGVVLNVDVAPALLTIEHKGELEERTKEAMTAANRAAKELHIQGVRELTGGAELFPGFSDMLSSLER